MTPANGTFFISPIPAVPGIPTIPGFAAGAPGTATLSPLGSVALAAAPSETGNATSPNPGQVTLSQDTSEAITPGVHITEFAVDASTTSATLTGTIDP